MAGKQDFDVSDLQTRSHVATANGAERVRAEIRMGLGSLEVAGGAEPLLKGEFFYNVPELRPEIDYHVAEGVGTLLVRHESKIGGVQFRQVRNDWNLQFNDEMPLDLDVKLGAGNADLALGTLNLTRLKARAASGRLDAGLVGDQQLLEAIHLDAASGDVRLEVTGACPQLSSVKLGSASGRLALELNGAYAKLERIRAGSTSGKVDVFLQGTFPVLAEISCDLVSGALELLLPDALESDLRVKCNSVSGRLRLMLPANVGISVSARKISGHLDLPGFHKQGNVYVNEGYEETGARIRIDANTVSGAIQVRLSG